ncbi:MAG: hypothetical protein IKL52_00615 [Candidatus Gastranaerophilales bacterium]|nr:hypothetical protein [Candidatus Gastranaerophilales bacterium]
MRISNISSTSFNGLFKKKEKPQLTEEQKQYQKQGFKKGVAATTAIGVGLGAVGGGVYYLTQDMYAPQAIVMPYQEGVTDLDEIEKTLDVDGRTFEIRENGTLSIPVKYDYLQDEIDERREAVFSPSSSSETKEANYRYIQKLQEKQEYQQSIATVYKEGDFIYFNLIFNDREGISVEEFKKIFDIKDGELSAIEENGIKKDWTIGEYYAGNDSHLLTSGMLLVIDKDGINTYNISFDY